MEKEEKFLSKIDSPDDLKKLNEKDLVTLAEELRGFIIDAVSVNPGHLGANLGAIELTLALHYVFNTPYDRIVWDVGHQAYAHKIITGRRDAFHSNRKYHGISGFPRITESEYDAFGVGHSSTSISAALGMAVASALKEDNGRQHVAIIGDGSLTAGMAMEALNNAGVANSNLLIILNDNGIAIDKNTGALKEYLAHINCSRTYNRFRNLMWKALGGDTSRGKSPRGVIKRLRNAVKSSIFRNNNLFESFNIRYFGPVDGHDVVNLVKILNDLKKINGPKLLHCVTTKGKGYDSAEKDQVRFHAPGLFDKNTGESVVDNAIKPEKYQDVFGKTIVELAKKNSDIVAITPAMTTGSSLTYMMNEFPDRTFDVGIAEQHAVTFAAGMAAQGLMPFCNIYSTFMQRAFDQVVHDVAIQNLDVVLCLDRGGLVGEDGATHHGVYDLSYFRGIPNMTISAPLNERELRNLMYTAQDKGNGPFVIRYPRGRGVMIDWQTPFEKLEIGKGRKLIEGRDAAIVSIGHAGNFAIKASEIIKKEYGKEVAVYDMRFLKPIDKELLHDVFVKHKRVITVEDGTIIGGLGSAVMEFACDNRYGAKIKRLGVPDKVIEQGTPNELYEECGFDVDSIVKITMDLIG